MLRLRTVIITINLLLLFNTTIGIAQTPPPDFSKEPESVRAFRAKGMLNKYYRERKSDPVKASAYLATIIKLFPEVPRAQLEWVFELQRQGNLLGAYDYLLSIQNQFKHNEKIQLALTNLSALLNKKQDAKPTPIVAIKKTPKPIFIAPTVIAPTIKAAPTETEMMDHYFTLKRENDDRSGALLKKISDLFPNNFDAQVEMGYYLLKQHKDEEALSYFLKAQKIRPDDFTIANQIGFIESKLGLNKKAYQQFKCATQSSDETTSSEAQVALINLSGSRFKYLPDPWFFDFYTEPYYTSRFDDYIAPLEARLGKTFGRDKQAMIYFSYRQSTDTASSNSGVAPQIYNDNAGVIAGGTRVFPVANVPWFFYAEYGVAFNIGNQTTTPPWEQDFRGGSSYSQQWGAPAAYASKYVIEFKPWTDVYANVGYYSRYTNWIGQGRQRIGARVFRWRHTTLSPYVMGQYFFDSLHLFYNNVVEYGPGIVLQPYNTVNFSISYEHLFGAYIPTQDSVNNPYGSHYQTNIVRAQFFIRI